MIYDFFWKLSARFIRFLRIFDKDISAGNLWKVKIHKLTNCWVMHPVNFQYKVSVGCAYWTKRHGEKVEAYAAMDDATGEDVKISDTTSAPRVTVKLYIPFKISRASIQLNIGNWMTDHEEYLSKDVDISDYEPGIHEVGIFIEDIINHYKERGYSP